jgi:hypothetical protein
VEVLDAAGVSLGAMLGRYVTALVIDTMMASAGYIVQTVKRRCAVVLEHLLYRIRISFGVEREKPSSNSCSPMSERKMLLLSTLASWCPGRCVYVKM